MRKQVQAIDRSNRLSPTAIDYEVLVLLEKGQDTPIPDEGGITVHCYRLYIQ